MTIKKQLLLSSGIQVVLFLIVGIILLYGYRYVTKQASTANSLDNQSKYLQMILRGVNEVIITEGTPQSIEIVQEGLDGFGNIQEELSTDINDPEIQRVFTDRIIPKWESIKTGVIPFLERDLDVEAEGLMMKYGKVITDTDAIIKEINSLSRKTRAVINEDSKRTIIVRNTIILILLISLVGVLMIAAKLYRSILSPIKELSNIAEGFGDGNFSIYMNDSRKNEFGKLASHFNTATGKLSNFIFSLKDNINTLKLNSKEVSTSASQIASHAQEQSSQTTLAATAMEELSSSFVEVTQNANHAATSAKEATILANNGGDVVKQTINGMNMIAQSVKESAQTIESLGKSSEQIGEIIKVINDIAGQTNLLALNAAIEAARAGEQGRGFAVVADEVRKLAEKTTASTNEIGEMIKNIQDESNKAVESMKKGTRDVESGVDLANQAGDSLMQIVSAAQSVTNMIQQIATAAEQQSHTGSEVASNIELVATSTHSTSDDVQQTSAASQQLYAMVSDIQTLANGFKLRNGKHPLKK